MNNRGEIRKRSEETEVAFQGSKKTLRSPQQRQIEEERRKQSENNKQTEQEESVMDELKVMISKIMESNEEIKQELRELRNENKVKEEKWEEEKQVMMGKIEHLENMMEKTEKEKRKKNIVIKGFKLKGNNIKEEIEEYLSTEMQVNTKIMMAYKITLNNKEKNEIVIAELESLEKKLEILKAKNKIKRSTVYIDSDLTQCEREIQRQIRSIAREEGGKGKTVKIGYQKLTVNGKEYRWNMRQKGLVEITTKNY